MKFLTPGQMAICLLLFFLPWVELQCPMPKGAMGAMNSAVQLNPVSPGKYRARLNVEMRGAWTMTIQFLGKSGEGKTAFTVNAE